MKKTVVIGVTGGIAAYKILDLVELLKKEHIDSTVMMTYGATKIVAPKEFEKVTENKVYTDIFGEQIEYTEVLKTRTIDHIDLARKADVIVIAPATANSIAKIANGIADDFVTTTVLAARTPIIVCPSMNTFMWTNPQTQQNIQKLQDAGYIILDPQSGLLACGDEGTGKLVHSKEIAKEIIRNLYRSDMLKGKKVIVTAGGTREYIDDVRFITNRGSGKMGSAIAEAAYLRGAEVLFIHSIISVKPRYQMKEKMFETAKDLQKILAETVSDYDICFHTSAVSDFVVKEKIHGKISSDQEITITLKPQEKIINTIKTYNPKIFLVAFKAVWDVSEEKCIQNAKEKLQTSHADMIIANDVGKKDQGFDVDTNEVIVIDTKGKTEKIPLASKRVIGEKIVEHVVSAFI